VVAADAATAALKTMAAVSATFVLMDTSTTPGLIDCGTAVATHAPRNPKLFGLFPADQITSHEQKLRSSPGNKPAVSGFLLG
jgi:hypothetical protein